MTQSLTQSYWLEGLDPSCRKVLHHLFTHLHTCSHLQFVSCDPPPPTLSFCDPQPPGFKTSQPPKKYPALGWDSMVQVMSSARLRQAPGPKILIDTEFIFGVPSQPLGRGFVSSDVGLARRRVRDGVGQCESCRTRSFSSLEKVSN